VGRRPHPRSRHADSGDGRPPRDEPAGRRVYRAGDDRPRRRRPARGARSGGPPRPPREPRGPRAGGQGGHGARTLVWLLVILVVAVGAGWALLQNMGDGGSSADEPPRVDPAAQAGDPIMRLTIPEGLRREDIAELIERETDLSGERYLALTAEGPRGRALARADEPRSLEGFLFPATYEIYADTTERDLVDAQVEAFAANTADIDFGPARRRNLTPYEVVIIASMVEREVAVPAERELVASVIYNRLRTGMTLGIDATVQYAIGEWKPELTNSDLDVDSPYNTRKFAGLPPGPIANPGRDSLRAAARPRDTEFLFYVAKFDGSGGHYFSTNAEQFEVDVQRSRQNAAGG